MKRCVIVSAAEIKNYERVRTYLKTEDFYIFCDGGLNHVENLQIQPDLIIGDFDSHNRPEADKVNGKTVEVIQLPHEKDWTDTYYATMEGLKRGFTEFLLLGVIGQRFDHSLSNISAILHLQEAGARSVIVDDYSEMELVVGTENKTLQVSKAPDPVGSEEIFAKTKPYSGNTVYVPDSFAYFSVMCVDGDVSGLTIRNAQYPLDAADVKCSFQYTSSNEVLPGQTAEITVNRGRLLVIKVFDR